MVREILNYSQKNVNEKDIATLAIRTMGKNLRHAHTTAKEISWA